MTSEHVITKSIDPAMLRRAAAAVRNAQQQMTGDKAWIGWVPDFLNLVADDVDQAVPVEPALAEDGGVMPNRWRTVSR